MLRKLLNIILSVTLVSSGWIFSTVAYARLAENVFLTSDAPIINTDCMDSTNYLQDLEHYVQRLRDGMTKVCAINSMNSCSSSTDNALLVKYRKDIDNLHADLKDIMLNILDKTCSNQKKKL
jgi:hypothetical protein